MTNAEYKLMVKQLRDVASILEMYPEMSNVWDKVEDTLTELISVKQHKQTEAAE